jgi:ubiquinol-cytochrome c reductase cytochrome b subunit
MHFWGASAMVLFIGIHMAQVFLFGAYKFPREMNWLSGSILLLVTLAMGFTGQLLRWDQNAVWSVVVAASQASRAPVIGPQLARFLIAGDSIGGATLSRFFAFHVFFIPAIIFAVIGLHLFLVLRNGISEPPKIGRVIDPKTYRQWYNNMLHKYGRPFWPDAAWRDAVFSIATIIGIAALALIFGAPQLDKPPDPTIIQAYPRPDWYLLWYFAALALIPPGAESFVIIGGPLFLGLILFVMAFVANKGERSPYRRPWAFGVVLLAVIMIGVLWISGEQATWSPAFQAQPLPANVVNSTDLVIQRGATLFHDKGCQYCHTIGRDGGERGPNLSEVGSRLTNEQLTVRILNGGNNMPAYGSILKPDEVDALVSFLHSRTATNASGTSPPVQAHGNK